MWHIQRIYIVACDLEPHDPRRQLAYALKAMTASCTLIKCDHAAGVTLDSTKEVATGAPKHPDMQRLECSCDACHYRVWKHIIKTSQHDAAWYFVIDLSKLTFEDTTRLMDWLEHIPQNSIIGGGCNMVIYKRSTASYILSGEAAYGMWMVAKDRHPQEYKHILRPCILTPLPTSIIGSFLDVMGFDSIACFLSTNIFDMYPQVPEITYFHVLALLILLVNFYKLGSVTVTVICIIELMVLSLPGRQ